MSILAPATGSSYLKAGFLGFAGAGKTFTALLLAIGTRKMFGLDGPIAIFDTERGSDDIASYVLEQTGKPLLVAKRRSLADLMSVVRECESAGVSVLIVDSITHVWRECIDSYQRARRQQKRSDLIDMQGWGRIKGEWQQWPDAFLNVPMHMIVCGRAGYEFEQQENEDGRREMVKSGIKMKAEGEFGFEPGLVVEMQRDFATDRKGRLTEERNVINRAVVLKDRKRVLDGRACEDPTFEFFRPHVELLKGGTHVPVDTQGRTEFHLDPTGRDKWDREKAARKSTADEIAGFLQMIWPGQSADEKKARASAMHEFWNAAGWTKLAEETPSEQLKGGLEKFIRKHKERLPPEVAAQVGADEMPDWAGGKEPK